MCHWGKLSYVESDGEPEIAGRYRLTDRIGHGGMGTVWLAEDGLLGRRVAVKRLRLPPQLDDDERARLLERTRREARSAARISHPNVIVVHDVVEDSGLPCIVMEYVPARSLGDALKEQGPLSPDAAVRTALAMTSALRAAHAAGVLHRDVKPANVLLSEEGARPVLTDFGIAAASGTATLTRTGEFVGSMAYTAPERFHGADSTPAADVWALGATLYEAVEGRTPFERDTWLETAYAAATEEPHPMQRAGVLAPVLERLLAKDPEERPALEEAERLLRDAYGGGRRTEEHTQVPAPAPESATGAAAGATAGSAAGAAPGTAAGSATGSATGSEATTTYGRGEHHGRNSAVSAPSPAAAGTSVEEPVTAHGSTTGHGSATGHGHGSTPGNPGDPAHAGTHTGPGYTRHTPGAQPSQPSHNSGPGYGAGPVPVLDDGSATGGSAVAGDPHGTVVRPPGKPRRRGARVLAWSAAVAVVAAAAATGGWMLARDDLGAPEPTTPPKKPGSSDSAPPRPETPAGYHRVNDPLGFSADVPDGWQRKAMPGGTDVRYIAPSGLTALTFSVLDYANNSPLRHLREVETQVKPKSPGYERLRLNGTRYQDQPAAIWEYTFEGRARTFRAIDLSWGKPGQQEYAVYLSTPDAAWPGPKEYFHNATASFRPREDKSN